MTSEFGVRYLTTSEHDKWDTFVRQSPSGSLFASSLWLKAVGLPFEILGCFESNELVGGIAVNYKSIFRQKWIKTPKLTPYQGLIFRAPEDYPFALLDRGKLNWEKLAQDLIGIRAENRTAEKLNEKLTKRSVLSGELTYLINEKMASSHQVGQFKRQGKEREAEYLVNSLHKQSDMITDKHNELRSLERQIALSLQSLSSINHLDYLAPGNRYEYSIYDDISKTLDLTYLIIRKLLQDFDAVEIANHFTVKDIRPFIWSGFEETINYTYILKLCSIKELWNNLNERKRRDINEGIANGLKVQETLRPRLFFKLYEDTYQKRGLKPPISFQRFAAIVEALDNNNQAKMYLVQKHGNYLSAVLIVWGFKRAYYLMGASDPNHLEEKASSLALWSAIEALIGRCSELDLVGANTETIAEFKRGFGGSLVPMYGVKKGNSLLAKSFFSGKRFLNNGSPKYLKNLLVNLSRRNG